jgi:hypothetical protein
MVFAARKELKDRLTLTRLNVIERAAAKMENEKSGDAR